MAKKGGGKKTARKKAAAPKTPRQPRLPGQEDAVIEALEEAAERYAEIRDARQQLTIQEVALKESVRTIMHREKLTHYKHGIVEIDLIAEDEAVKVRLRKSKADDENPEE